MKRTGPPPKPTNLKLVQGTYRKDRGATNEAKPEIEIPPVPSHLSDEAKAEWGRVSRELASLGLLSRIDRAALAGYCEFWADWVEACDKVAKLGKVIKTGERVKTDDDGKIVEKSGGNYIENPYYTIKKRSAELMHKFLTEFGMTPASRSRINAEPQEPGKSSRWKKYGN